MGASSPRYTAEFKQKAVELYKKSGTTYAEVARDNDVRWLDADAFESARALHERMIEEIRSYREERKNEAE